MIDVSTCEISTTFENKSSASANYRLENHQEIFHAKTDVKTDAGFFYSKTDGKTDAGFFGACRPLRTKFWVQNFYMYFGHPEELRKPLKTTVKNFLVMI